MNQEEFIDELAKLRPSSTFLVLHSYKNAHGEVADFNICFHISYKNALEKSLIIAEAIRPTSDLERRARAEVIQSLERSLHRIETTSIEDIDDAYQRFFDENNKYIKGVKLHIESNTLHLYGLIHLKKILQAVEYKKVNSAPLTIAKKNIFNQCPVSRFREFKIHPSQVEKITVEKTDLPPPDTFLFNSPIQAVHK